MISIGISTFRQNMFQYMKSIERGNSIQLVSHGRDVAIVIPPSNRFELARKKLKELRKTAKIGDVVSPVEDIWDVEK